MKNNLGFDYIPPVEEPSLVELLTGIQVELTGIRDELRTNNELLRQLASTVNKSTTKPQIRTICNGR